MGDLITGFFGTKPSTPKPISNNAKSSTGSLFGMGGSKKPGYQAVKDASIKKMRYRVNLLKDRNFTNSSLKKTFGDAKVYKLRQGKEDFSVKDVRKLLTEAIIHVGQTRENPKVEDITEFLVKKKGFLREDAKEMMTIFGRTIYAAPVTGPTAEQVSERIRAIKAMEGISSNYGNNLALNRQKGSKRAANNLHGVTSVDLNTLDTGNKEHVVHVGGEVINTDKIRSGGINMATNAKVSVADDYDREGVVAGHDASSVTKKSNVIDFNSRKNKGGGSGGLAGKSIPFSKTGTLG